MILIASVRLKRQVACKRYLPRRMITEIEYFSLVSDTRVPGQVGGIEGPLVDVGLLILVLAVGVLVPLLTNLIAACVASLMRPRKRMLSSCLIGLASGVLAVFLDIIAIFFTVSASLTDRSELTYMWVSLLVTTAAGAVFAVVIVRLFAKRR